MKNDSLILIGLAAVALVWYTSKSTGVAPAGNGLASLNDSYGADNVARLQLLLDELNTWGLTREQILYLLSQALQETGLFTDTPNYHATDSLINYSGISFNGSLNSYASVHDFAVDWINRVLAFGSFPLQATSISDFNIRLKANGYYTDSSTTYGNNLASYYGTLNAVI